MVNTMALGVLTVYMVLVLGIGIIAWQYTDKTPHDFYLASSKLGISILVMTLFATIASAFTFFGLGASASATGLGTFAFLATEMIFFTLLFGTVGVKVYKIGSQLGHLTPTEYLQHRYEGSLTSITYLLVCTGFLIAFIATQIIGGAVALEILINIPYWIAVLFITAFMAVYLHLAGMRGLVWSDALQGVIMYGSVLLLFIWVLISVGPNELVSNVQTTEATLFTLPGPADLWMTSYMVSFAWVFVFGVIAYPAVFQRFLAADSSKTVRLSAIIMPLLGITIFFMAVALGVWSHAVIDTPDIQDHVIPLMFTELFPTVIAAIGLSAGVAALMSTADSLILSLGSLFSRDIYAEYVNPDITPQEEVRVNQVIIFAIIVLACGLAWYQPATIFDLTALVYTGLAATVPALYGSLYWEKATESAAVVSMIVGVLGGTAAFYEYIPPEYLFGFHPGLLGIILSTVLFIAVSYLTSNPSKDTLDKYDLAD